MRQKTAHTAGCGQQPAVGPGNGRIGPIHFLASWRNRRPESGSVSLGVVLHMLVIFINFCLGFIGFTSTNQLIGSEGRFLHE